MHAKSTPLPRPAFLCALLACVAIVVGPLSADAQPPEVRARIEAAKQAKMQKAQAAKQKNQKPKADEAKKAAEKKDDDKKKGEAKPSSGGEVKRPDAPPKVPDPRELEVEVVNGRVQFAFNGQPWPDVLQWIANASKLSLDWQELPSGYLNLTTQRAYTLTEARDLINRHLQARGFVMLLSGEVLSVTKIDKLDPSLVPRITEDELYDRQPHDFVKVTFQLPKKIDVKQASEDVKQALSKHAKLMPLAATQRLLAIDAVANLRLVSALLNEERLEEEGREVPKRFKLRYARAEKVINTLYVVMGLDPASRPSQMELQLQQKKLDLLKQMQQRGKDVAKMLNNNGPPVFLAFNRHDNSILANAPPEQLEIIERTIKMLDIPAPGMATPANGDMGERYAKTYELESIEPDSLINSLEEIGNLDPLTDLRGDKKSKVLFALASQGDHERIMAIIEQLDGPKFRVEVFWLRRHPADAVAGTVAALIGGKKEKKDNNRRSFFSWRFNDEEDEEEEVELRVDADVENNRLIVRGNDAQIAEVRQLLKQLGELPDEQAVASRPGVRVFDALDSDDTSRLLEQLRRAWPAMGGDSELIIQDNRPDAPVESQESKGDRTTSVGGGARFRFAVDATAANSNDSGEEVTTVAEPKVSITVTEDGRLVISSSEPELLDRLDRMIETLTPDEATFAEFKLEHRGAKYVLEKLEDFYEDILKAKNGGQILDWFGRMRDTGPKDQGSRLSRRRKLRMVYNAYTNSIVVTNATPSQLREIERLIEIWDQPAFEKGILQRRTGMVKVQYSRATTIAKALKEVYRDLLSSRDKEFATEEDKGGSSLAWETLTRIEYSGAESVASGRPPQTQVTDTISTTFDGALSIGVDELANMIVVSADRELYESVVDMIKKLDEQARPKTSVQVVRVDVPAGPLREALDDALERPWPGGKPEQQTSNGGNQNRQRGQNGRRGRSQQGQRRR